MIFVFFHLKFKIEDLVFKFFDMLAIVSYSALSKQGLCEGSSKDLLFFGKIGHVYPNIKSFDIKPGGWTGQQGQASRLSQTSLKPPGLY